MIAAVGLVVALLTLRPLEILPDPALPAGFDTGAAVDVAGEFEAGAARPRPVGSPNNSRTADFMRRQFEGIPGSTVKEQEFSGRDPGGNILRMRNVFMSLPAPRGSGVPGGILVVAPRDTPPEVGGGASASAIVVQLARTSATVDRRRPMIFVSTDGNALGNSGIRFFLSRFNDFRIAAAIVLDAPAVGEGDEIHIWSAGTGAASAPDLAASAARAIERANGTPRRRTGLVRQVLDRALPLTFGDQAALNDAGIPAVTLSQRAEAPLGPTPSWTAERMALAGASAQNLLGAIDAGDTPPAPTVALVFGERAIEGAILRAAALLLLLPVIVGAIDMVAALRRARAPLRPAVLRALRLLAAVLVGAVTGRVVALTGVVPGAAAGAPALPERVPLDATALLVLIVAVGVGWLSWFLMSRGAPPPAPRRVRLVGAVACSVVLMVVLWAANPFAMAALLPFAHGLLLVTAARRGWQAAVLAAFAILPLAWVLLTGAAQTGLSAPDFTWYLLETSATGARGVGVPLLVAGTLALALLAAADLLRAAAPRVRERAAATRS